MLEFTIYMKKEEKVANIFRLKKKCASHGILTIIKYIPTILAKRKKKDPFKTHEKKLRLDIDMWSESNHMFI